MLEMGGSMATCPMRTNWLAAFCAAEIRRTLGVLEVNR
jgi:hypothetical protein